MPSESPTQARPAVEEDIYKDWNPMKEITESALNLTIYDNNEMGIGFTGAPIKEGFYCSFQVEGQDKCYKEYCNKPHRTYSVKMKPSACEDSDEENIPESNKVPVQLYDGLPRQRNCPEGITCMGQIVHVVDPFEFYIMPETDWSCLCKKNISDGIDTSAINDSPRFKHSGLDPFNVMIRELQQEMQRNCQQTNFYSMSELVAFNYHKYELDSSTNKLASVGSAWVRAVVTRPTFYKNEVDDNKSCLLPECPLVGITLLDSGEKLITKTLNLALLPKKFYQIPSYAYKCKLFGIIPIGDDWCSEAKTQFKEFLGHKQVLVQVHRTIFPEEEGRGGIFVERPYSVSLRVRGGLLNNYLSVEYLLAEKYLGLLFNPLMIGFYRQVGFQFQNRIEKEMREEEEPEEEEAGDEETTE